MLQNKISHITASSEGLSIADTIRLLAAEFPGGVVFSSSFSFEDQVITHEILSNNIPVNIFTLDTGRLFPETYSVWSRTNEVYHTQIQPYYPKHDLLETFVTGNGPNAFYDSVEKRKECCFIRKVEPLKRALSGKQVWITGLRAEHSPARMDLTAFEWDGGNEIIKYHPLLNWTTEETRNYINKNDVPHNILHDRGFVSIGCAPCTRATRPGEDFRAGRWWWEDASKKECGLHEHADTSVKLN